MAEQTRIERAARFLFGEHQARRRYRPIPEADRPRDVAEAYSVQDALLVLRAAAGRGPIAGYKIGLTTPVMRDMMGVDQPIAGAILADVVQRSPARVADADFIQLAIEPEIALRLGADLPGSGAPYSRERVGFAVAACAPAFELVEDRKADYGAVTALELIADNSWNGGIVLGSEVAYVSGLDLSEARALLRIDGRAAGEGRGADAMGHPFEVLAWLANMLAGRGKPLERGMVVMTGSVVTTKHLEPGQSASLSIEGLGEAELTVI